MTSPIPAQPGCTLDEIDTPALLVDLDALEANILGMADQAAAAGKALRPHAKTHKCAAVARLQLAAGAVGLCVQKISEGEALLFSGVRDLLLSNHIIGDAKLTGLTRLAAAVRLTVLAADEQQLPLLAAAAQGAGREIEVLIEVDAGDARMGVADPEQALGLGRAIAATQGLRLRGIQAYTGPLQHERGFANRSACARLASDAAERARGLLLEAGLSCELLTGGGTGTFGFDLAGSAFNEIQPGSYVFMDADYARNKDAAGGAYRPFRQSLFVLSTVMNTQPHGAVYVDAGAKALNFDSGPPLVEGRPDLCYTKASDEQGRVEITGAAAPALGDRLWLVPGHCDPTVNLHDWIVGIRGGRVEAVFPVSARGCLL